MEFMSNVLRMSIFIALPLLIFCFDAFGIVLASKPLPSGITISTSVDSNAVGTPREMMIHITALNESDTVVRFSRRETILDIGLEEDYFDVLNNGTPMNFSPIHIKRAEETDADKLVLLPGQSFTNSIPIAPYYNVSSKGLYSLALKSAVSNGVANKKKSHQISVLNSLGNNTLIQAKRTFAHRSCSTVQVNQLDGAIDQANVIARAAITDLNATADGERGTAARYREWFGTFSASRYNQIVTNFSAIDNVLTNQQISTDCGCDAIAPAQRNNVFAYVFPDQPFIVNLCGAFWPAPLIGTNSQAGIIVHEVSHFIIVADTIDNAVGVNASKSLARSNPNAAILNADNHEYFAENTPRLRMSSSDVSCKIAETNSISAITQPSVGTNFSSNSLSQAVDDLNHNYLTETPSFFRTTSLSSQGGDSAQSANIGDSQNSSMLTSVVGPGTVSFDWSVSSEQNFDFLVFLMIDSNGGVVGAPADISGNVSFTRRTFSFPAGQHFLVWAYIKDISLSSGRDAGNVDNIRITEPGGLFVSSNSQVTNVVCNRFTTLAPIINFLLDE